MTSLPTNDQCDLAAQAAQDGFELDVDTVTPIATWDSTVFRLATRQGTFAMRAHEPGGRLLDAIRAELRFLRHLGDRGLAGTVPAPRASRPGPDLYVPHGDNSGPAYDVTTWLDGVRRRDGFAAGDVYLLGRTLANIHLASREFRVPKVWRTRRPAFDPIRMLADPDPAVLECAAPWLTPSDRAELERILADAIPSASAWLGLAEQGAVHRDFILGNCVWRGRDVAVIDFADAGMGPYVYDLAPMLTNMGEVPALRRGLIAGYTAARPLPAAEEAALPLLEVVRHLSVALDIATKASSGLAGPDPDIHVPYRMAEIRRVRPLFHVLTMQDALSALTRSDWGGVAG